MNSRVLLPLGGVLILIIALIWIYASFYSTANQLENAARAQYQSNQNAYDKMWKTISETAQVPAQYKQDFQDLLVAENAAKFGKDGSQATMQWFQERDLHFDATLYSKIQTVIEAGRADFAKGQDELLDKQRRYHDHLGSFTGRMFASMSGHPMIVQGKYAPAEDLDGDGRLTALDYPIVTSAQTQAAFATGEAEALDVFGNKAKQQ